MATALRAGHVVAAHRSPGPNTAAGTSLRSSPFIFAALIASEDMAVFQAGLALVAHHAVSAPRIAAKQAVFERALRALQGSSIVTVVPQLWSAVKAQASAHRPRLRIPRILGLHIGFAFSKSPVYDPEVPTIHARTTDDVLHPGLTCRRNAGGHSPAFVDSPFPSREPAGDVERLQRPLLSSNGPTDDRVRQHSPTGQQGAEHVWPSIVDDGLNVPPDAGPADSTAATGEHGEIPSYVRSLLHAYGTGGLVRGFPLAKEVSPFSTQLAPAGNVQHINADAAYHNILRELGQAD